MRNPVFEMLNRLKQAQNPFGMARQFAGGNQDLLNAIGQLQSKGTPQEKEQFIRNLYQSRNQDINQMASQFGLNIQQPPRA